MEEAMRIDGSPSLAEIRSSIMDGTVVVFFNHCGEQVRGKVLDAKLDPEVGRVALALEEERTGLVWFARYCYGSVRCASGDIVTWNLRRNQIENMANGSLWQRCSGE
jgi:hypothetical protein